MSAHVEWTGAPDTRVELASPGDTVGEDTLDEGCFALVIGNGDSFHVVEGSVDDLKLFAARVAGAAGLI